MEQVSDYVVMLEGGRVARSGAVSDLLGKGTPLVVEVVKGAGRLAERLAALGVTATSAKDDLRLTIPPGAEGVQDAVVQAVAELDLELRRMERGQPTLGDLFDLEEVRH